MVTPVCVELMVKLLEIVPLTRITDIGLIATVPLIEFFAVILTVPFAPFPNWSVPVTVTENALPADWGFEIALILRLVAAPATCDKDPKFVVPVIVFIVPVIAAVILPPLERLLPSVACTATPLIVNLSVLLVPVTDKLRVIVE